INTYKKPGEGVSPFHPKVLQLVTTNASPASPFPATLTSYLQLAENKTTLSPAVATLTGRVKHKPFVCHSYKKHREWGYVFPARNLLRRPRGNRYLITSLPPYFLFPRMEQKS